MDRDIRQGRWVCCTCCPVPVRNLYNNIILILRKGMMRCGLSNPCCWCFWVPLDQPKPGFWSDLNRFLDRSNISCSDFYLFIFFNPTKNLAAFSISHRQACPFFFVFLSVSSWPQLSVPPGQQEEHRHIQDDTTLLLSRCYRSTALSMICSCCGLIRAQASRCKHLPYQGFTLFRLCSWLFF